MKRVRVRGFELAAGFVLLASIAVGAAGGGSLGHAAAGAGQGLTAGAGIAASGVFADLGGHWAASSVSDAVYQGYVDGYPDGTFKPEQSVTRAEFVKMAITALKLPLGPAGGVWYDAYVRGAVSAGMYKYDFASGTWDDPITREEMTMLAVRAAVKDVRDAVAYDKKKYIYAATKAGLIQGMDDRGTLGLDQPTTRAQSVTIIERILTVERGGKLVADKHAVSRAEVEWHGTNIFTMLPRYFGDWNIDDWDLSKFHWESLDGIYKEVVVEYKAVDMEDPNDPFRDEIAGMKFRFVNYADNDKTSMREAPAQSYVTFSKIKQTVTGKYPDSLYINDGGGITMWTISPKDMVGHQTNIDYEIRYSQMEESDKTIYFSKEAEGDELAQWNKVHNNSPRFSGDFPKEGGIFYWTKAQVHPKGDFYPGSGLTTAINYTPNISYMVDFGPRFNTGFNGMFDPLVRN